MTDAKQTTIQDAFKDWQDASKYHSVRLIFLSFQGYVAQRADIKKYVANVTQDAVAELGEMCRKFIMDNNSETVSVFDPDADGSAKAWKCWDISNALPQLDDDLRFVSSEHDALQISNLRKLKERKLLPKIYAMTFTSQAGNHISFLRRTDRQINVKKKHFVFGPETVKIIADDTLKIDTRVDLIYMNGRVYFKNERLLAYFWSHEGHVQKMAKEGLAFVTGLGLISNAEEFKEIALTHRPLYRRLHSIANKSDDYQDGMLTIGRVKNVAQRFDIKLDYNDMGQLRFNGTKRQAEDLSRIIHQ